LKNRYEFDFIIECIAVFSSFASTSGMQVSRAVDHVQQGTKNLENAKNLGKNTRKWMCCALIVLLVIAAIIAVVVFMQSG